MQPESYDELARAERTIARLGLRLRQVGVTIQFLPGGEMIIPGETWPDGSPRPDS